MENLLRNLILPRFNLTYSEYIAYSYAILALSWAIYLSVLSFIGRAIIKRFDKKIRMMENHLLISNQDFFEESKEPLSFKELSKYFRRKNSAKPILIQLAFLLSEIGCFLSSLVYGIIPSILSSLGTISVSKSILFMSIISLITAYFMIKLACPSEIKKLIKAHLKNDKSQFRKKFYMQSSFVYMLNPFAFKSFAVILASYPMFTPFITYGSCMAYYAPADFGSAIHAYSVSTTFSRLFSETKACPSGKICHIYSTLPEDPATSAILNVQTGSDIDSLYVLYATEEDLDIDVFEEYATNQTFKSYHFDIEWKAQRYVHSSLLNGLKPDTLYYARIFHKNKFLGETKFSTLPSQNMERNITIISGGDSGGTEKSISFITHISQYNPDVIVIGGDIVYDNGNVNCYSCWNYFLDQLKVLNQNRGRLVPVILGVGNHDVGLHGYQFLQIDKYKNLLFLYFPQNIIMKNGKAEIPDPDERMSYFHHKIGHTLHVSLDSGYLTKYSGIQTSWLRNISREHINKPKLATYHVPIIPACYYNPEKYGHDSRIYTWVPIFENYKYMGIFENHMHLFKRTFPLSFSNNTKGPGVVYFGDGAIGVSENDCFDRDTEYNITGAFAKIGKINHLWIIKMSAKTINYSAINLEGSIIDDYTQKISDYVSTKVKNRV